MTRARGEFINGIDAMRVVRSVKITIAGIATLPAKAIPSVKAILPSRDHQAAI
jgi:hypothetical protein